LATTLVAMGMLGSSVPVRASPPPPPPPGLDQEIAKASCRDVAKPVAPEPLAFTVSSLAAETVGVRDGRLGELTWKWGMRISSKDARVGPLAGLGFNSAYGLFGVTAAGQWSMFDVIGPDLAHVRGVAAAQIVGAPGRPLGLVEHRGQVLVGFPDQNQIDRFELSVCGVAARGVAMITVADPAKLSAFAPGRYSYLGVVAQQGREAHDTLVLPYGRGADAVLSEQNLTPPPGYRLQALSNPEPIVPFVLGLWRPETGVPGALLQTIHVQGWDEFGPGPSQAKELARLKRPMTAMVGVSDSSNRRVWIFLAADAGVAGAVDLYAFTYDRPWGETAP
jgi:hypothetical protein